MKLELLNEKKEDIIKFVTDKGFYNYDLKDEMFKDYELINKTNYLIGNPTDDERNTWKEIRAYNKYVGKIEFAKKVFKSNADINRIYNDLKNKTCDYSNLKKYLLFRYQASKSKGSYDYFEADSSYLVYLYYNNYLKKQGGLSDIISISDNNYIPIYFDTYFSFQSIWGELINNLYSNTDISYNSKKRRTKLGNDYEWQLLNFDKIVNKGNKELLSLFDVLNEFAKEYHTIGNLAPCAPSINSPKGMSSCYDRIDLFFEKMNNNWLKWYFNTSINILENEPSVIVRKLYLNDFIKPKHLAYPVIPKSIDDIDNIIKLREYLNELIKIINDRKEKLKNN